MLQLSRLLQLWLSRGFPTAHVLQPVHRHGRVFFHPLSMWIVTLYQHDRQLHLRMPVRLPVRHQQVDLRPELRRLQRSPMCFWLCPGWASRVQLFVPSRLPEHWRGSLCCHHQPCFCQQSGVSFTFEYFYCIIGKASIKTLFFLNCFLNSGPHPHAPQI